MKWRKITLGGQPMRWKLGRNEKGQTLIYLRDIRPRGEDALRNYRPVNEVFTIPRSTERDWDDWEYIGDVVTPGDVADHWRSLHGLPKPPPKKSVIIRSRFSDWLQRVGANEVFEALSEKALSPKVKAPYRVQARIGDKTLVLFGVFDGALAKRFVQIINHLSLKILCHGMSEVSSKVWFSISEEVSAFREKIKSSEPVRFEAVQA